MRVPNARITVPVRNYPRLRKISLLLANLTGGTEEFGIAYVSRVAVEELAREMSKSKIAQRLPYNDFLNFLAFFHPPILAVSEDTRLLPHPQAMASVSDSGLMSMRRTFSPTSAFPIYYQRILQS